MHTWEYMREEPEQAKLFLSAVIEEYMIQLNMIDFEDAIFLKRKLKFDEMKKKNVDLTFQEFEGKM